MTGNALVDAISEIAFEGNIIPESWYQTLRLPTGKPDLNAISILGELVYWYRGTEERDEATGELLGWRPRFKADLLQRSYDALAKKFGLTRRQVEAACHRLQARYGVIRLEVRKRVETATCVLGNVLYIALVPEQIRKITHPCKRSHGAPRPLTHSNVQAPTVQCGSLYVAPGELPHSNVQAPTVQCGTYPEIPTEISTEIPTGEGEGESPPPHAQAHEVVVPAQEQPLQPTSTPYYHIPADYTLSAEIRTKLEQRYPELNVQEEMDAIEHHPFEKPQPNWDYTIHKWFCRSARWGRKSPTAPGKDSGGDPKRDTTTMDKRTQQTERQFQAALEDYNTYAAKKTAMDISYRDITHDRARLPAISPPTEAARELLPRPYRPSTGQPAVF